MSALATTTDFALIAWDAVLARFNQIKDEHDRYDSEVWTPACEADEQRDADAGNPWPGVDLGDPENRAAIRRYYAKKEAAAAEEPILTPAICEKMDALQGAYLSAMDHLIEKVPAPHAGAVLLKFEMALKRAECFEGLFEDHREAILADLRRLAANTGIAAIQQSGAV